MNKIKQWCFHSVTIAVTYFLAFCGLLLDTVLSAQDLLPELKDEVTSALSKHPQIAAWVVVSISVITFFARMRSIWKSLRS